jgi:hypothetical protein
MPGQVRSSLENGVGAAVTVVDLVADRLQLALLELGDPDPTAARSAARTNAA